MGELENETLEQLYQWIDDIPLSRPKKSLGRDFSDGVLVAEVIRYFFPRMVDLHNYTPANSKTQKVTNWQTLNRKLFNKLGFSVPEEMMQAMVNCKPGVMEVLLSNLKSRIESEQVRRKTSKVPLDPEEGYVAAAARAAHREQQLAAARESKIPRRPKQHRDGHQHQQQQQHSHFNSIDSWPQDGAMANEFSFPPLGSASYGLHQPTAPSWHRSNTEPGHSQSSAVPDHLPSLGHPNHMTARSHGAGASAGIHASNPTNRGSWHNLGQDMNLVLEEKETTIMELQETVQLLQLKVRRLEHLLRVKDLRIEDLTQRLQQHLTVTEKQLPFGKRQ